MVRGCRLRLLARAAMAWAAADLLAVPASAACLLAPPYAEPVARAAARFAISEALVRAVIAAESNGAVRAISPKGAMGLMQLMPGTWAGLRQRHGLGLDPFDPCDNILAGTAYLRELLDRYGDPGFLAAYNAGPGRYEAWLGGAKPLPTETIAYVAKLSDRALAPGVSTATVPAPDPDAWRRGPLFTNDPAGARIAASTRDGNVPEKQAPAAQPAEQPSAMDGLFVARTGAPR